MRAILIILILFAQNSQAKYRVTEFDRYCGGHLGCEFNTKDECQNFLREKHKGKSLTDCRDITKEVTDKEISKIAEENERKEIKAMLKDLSKYDKVQEWRDKVNKLLTRIVKDNYQ